MKPHRHCEQSEAIQSGPERLDCVGALRIAMTRGPKVPRAPFTNTTNGLIQT